MDESCGLNWARIRHNRVSATRLEQLYCGTASGARLRARNLAADPRAVVNLESGEDFLKVRGTAVALGTPPEVRCAAAEYTRPTTGSICGMAALTSLLSTRYAHGQ